ncbi:MAG: hypothetical protein ACYCPQ_00695 [Elusimicrobiota bacterium]
MSELRPDAAAMLAHVGHLFGGLPEELRDSLIELAWTDARDGKLRHSRHFWTGELEELVDLAVHQNAKPGQNVYIGAALRGPDTARERRSSGKDFRALTAFYADFDGAGALEQAERLCLEKNIRATARVITGRQPHARGQLWWRLDASQTDPEQCHKINRAIADALGGDVTVVNAGRVMRLAGSIAWPKKPGRVPEMTAFAALEHPGNYAAEDIERAFPPKQIASAKAVCQMGSSGSHLADSRPSPDIETLLAQAVPGNWHASMLRAVAKMVACGWTDHDIQAKAESRTLPGWTVEQTRREVLAMISGAKRKGFADRPRLRRLVPDVEPAYQSDSLPREQAASELTSRISTWFDQAQSLALARRELARRYKSRFASRTPRDVAEELRAEVKAKHGVASLRDAPRLTIQAAAGLGKTEAVIAQIMSRRELWSLKTWIFVPTLNLAEKLAERFAELSSDPAHAPGPPVRVMRGRVARATDERGPREPKTMCRKPEAADLAGNLGINIFKSLCKSGAGRCEFYDRCPWTEQWQDHRPGVIILTHEYLHLPKPLGFPRPDLVVVDESIVEVLSEHIEFAPDRLTERPDWAMPSWVDGMGDILKKVHEALSSGEPILEAMRTRKIDRKMLAEAADRAEGGEDGDTGITPDMPQAEALDRLAALESSERRKLARLLRQLSKEVALDRPQAHSVVLRRNEEVKVEGKMERQNRLVVLSRLKIKIGRSTSVLLIDADADPVINSRLVDKTLEHQVIAAARSSDVTQCHSSTFSRRSMIGFPGAPARLMSESAGRLAKVKKIIETLSQDARLLVVCDKAVRRAITGEKDDKLPICCEHDGFTIAHFGNIKGSNLWRHHQRVLIVGRQQPRPIAVEDTARAIWDDDPEPLNLPGIYTKVTRGYRLKSGAKRGVEIEVHPDPRVQRVLEIKRERESLQAIDRLRLIHALHPKEVYILGNIPLDLDIDRLVNFRDLTMGREVSRLGQAYVRGGGVLPMIPRFLAETWPDLFPTNEAARWDLRRKIQDILNRPKPKTISSWNLAGSEFRPVTTGNGGHHNWSIAVLAADTPFFRARTRDLLGCKLIWKSPPSCRKFDPSRGESPDWFELTFGNGGSHGISEG